jgi:hypothetical protein
VQRRQAKVPDPIVPGGVINPRPARRRGGKSRVPRSNERVGGRAMEHPPPERSPEGRL